jgi:heme/copper-type cytochrome/quinol oxidase subunit 2
MDINMLLSTVVLVSFIVTIVLAVGSYLAFKGRERRRPEPELKRRGSEPVFFERIYLQPKKVDQASSVA